MSTNVEALSRIQPEQKVAVATESPVVVPALLDNKRPHIAGAKAGPPHPEILRLVHVLFLSSATAPHHVMFCGVDADDGSGSVCASAARTLASEVSSRVCLVDAKTLGTSVQRALNLDESGFPSSISLVQHSSVPRQVDRNLWFVSAVHLTSGGAWNGGAEQICSRLLDLRKEFGYLLVDAPPLGIDIMTWLLGQVADGVVLVLEANATRRATARRAKENLEAANVPLLGTVLNNRTFPIPEKLYRWL
jgi:Mrp family chromosome partitioning ATPase